MIVVDLDQVPGGLQSSVFAAVGQKQLASWVEESETYEQIVARIYSSGAYAGARTRLDEHAGSD